MNLRLLQCEDDEARAFSQGGTQYVLAGAPATPLTQQVPAHASGQGPQPPIQRPNHPRRGVTASSRFIVAACVWVLQREAS